jgi:small-conductance mechanosensitive channel
VDALERLWDAGTPAMHALRACVIVAAFWLLAHGIALVVRALVAKRTGKPLDPASPAGQSLGPLRALIVVLGLYYARGELPREYAGGRIAALIDGGLYIIAVLVATAAAVRIATLSMSAFLRRVPDAERVRAEREILPLARKVVGLLLTAIGVIIAFHHFGIEVTAIITTLGVGGLAVGFAAKDTLSNMIAGFTLLLDRPFRPGDRIRLATGEVGDVVDVGVRTTRIRMLDHNLLVVPNAEITNSRVVNFNLPTPRSVAKVEVRLLPDVNLGNVDKLMTEATRGIDAIVEPPMVLLKRIADGALELTMTCVLAEFADQDRVEDKLRREIVQRFGAAKILMARPQMDVAVTERR